MALLLPLATFSVSGQVLFDGTNGLPTSQGWSFAALFGGTQTQTNSAVLLDTAANNIYSAGYSRTVPGQLNRTIGFTVLFTSQMISEAHANANRAGFSVIVLTDDKRGIELAFWTNTIFAQSDLPLFTHAEETNCPTTALVDYSLTFQATNYVLTANGTTILSGPVRDYTAFSGPINPYSTPDFLFFGDDTTSAGGIVILRKVVLVTAPQLVALADNRIVWTGVTNLIYTVQSSSNLTSWATEVAVTSLNSQFTFTNIPSASPRFFRVTFP
jgi:hypothetical protein